MVKCRNSSGTRSGTLRLNPSPLLSRDYATQEDFNLFFSDGPEGRVQAAKAFDMFDSAVVGKVSRSEVRSAQHSTASPVPVPAPLKTSPPLSAHPPPLPLSSISQDSPPPLDLPLLPRSPLPLPPLLRPLPSTRDPVKSLPPSPPLFPLPHTTLPSPCLYPLLSQCNHRQRAALLCSCRSATR